MAAEKPNTTSSKASGTTSGKATRRRGAAPLSASRKAGGTKASTRQRRIILAYGVLSAITLVLLVAVLLLPKGGVLTEAVATTEGVASMEPAHQPEAGPTPAPAPEAPPAPAPEAGVRSTPYLYPETKIGPSPESEPVPAAAILPREISGRLYFVIDDAGYNMEQLQPFLEFPGALTIAVLPQLAYSVPAARATLAAGKEVILHQPMEAENGKDPGPGALYVGDNPGHIREVLATNLATVPGAVGMNNHMGSRATSDRATMEAVLLDTAERNLYFLDSRTAVSTVVAETAQSLGLSILERNVFLDNDPDRDSIDAAIREGMELASRRGHAVMIGHVMVTELAEALHDLYPEMLDEGYELLPLSQLLSNGRDDALPSHAHTRD